MADGNGWTDFFVAEVGATAALSGLVIVAVSINLQRILSQPILPGRAGESLIVLVGALMVASVGLIPHQSPRLLGFEIAAIGTVAWLGSMAFQVHSFVEVRVQPAQWWVPRLLMLQVTALPIIAGGTLLVFGTPEGMYFAAVGVLLSLIAGVLNTWVLLIEILR